MRRSSEWLDRGPLHLYQLACKTRHLGGTKATSDHRLGEGMRDGKELHLQLTGWTPSSKVAPIPLWPCCSSSCLLIAPSLTQLQNGGRSGKVLVFDQPSFLRVKGSPDPGCSPCVPQCPPWSSLQTMGPVESSCHFSLTPSPCSCSSRLGQGWVVRPGSGSTAVSLPKNL